TAIEAGAVGISTTRTILHRAKDGELAAGTNAAAAELIGIGTALADAGRRVFSVASDMLDLDGEIAWMAAISSGNRVPVTYQTLQVDFAPDLWRTWVDRGVAANRRGAWLVPQVAGGAAAGGGGLCWRGAGAHRRAALHPACQPPQAVPPRRSA